MLLSFQGKMSGFQKYDGILSEGCCHGGHPAMLLSRQFPLVFAQGCMKWTEHANHHTHFTSTVFYLVWAERNSEFPNQQSKDTLITANHQARGTCMETNLWYIRSPPESPPRALHRAQKCLWFFWRQSSMATSLKKQCCNTNWNHPGIALACRL